MNKQQQELYDELLKKVNEYCLGFAAEDVIESIDALVESYETPKVDPVSTPLQALDNIKKEAGIPYFSPLYDIDMWREDFKTVETALKALEIIKEKEVNVFIFLHSGDLETYNDMVEDNRKLTQEEHKLLKEVLK